MRQHYLAFEIFLYDRLAFLMVHRQSHYVCDHLGHRARIQASRSQNTSHDRIFVSLWNVSAAEYEAGEKEARIWAVGSWIGKSSLCDRLGHPVRLDDRFQGISGCIILGEV